MSAGSPLLMATWKMLTMRLSYACAICVGSVDWGLGTVASVLPAQSIMVWSDTVARVASVALV